MNLKIQGTMNDPLAQRPCSSPEDFVREGWLTLDLRLLAALRELSDANERAMVAQRKVDEVLVERGAYARDAAINHGVFFFPDLKR